jgi:hypothetical protein
MRAIVAMAVSAVLVTAVTGCSDMGGGSEAGSGADVSLDGPLLVTADPPAADGDAAPVSGPLSYESGCLRIGDHLVVWPNGTSWDDSAARLTFQGGTEAGVGDQISAEAVLLRPDELIEAWGGDSQISGDVASQVRGCAGTDGEVAVFAAG